MVAFPGASRLMPSPDPVRATASIATAGAMAAAALVSAACLAAPTDLLEALVVRSGVAALVNAAAPPLGLTARATLAMAGSALAAAVIWAVLVLLAPDRRVGLAWPRPFALPARIAQAEVAMSPSVRRADSHPDAPPRPPISAERDLGAPFLSIVAPTADPAPPERPVPQDLETALAAIDPGAIPAVPREPVRPVPGLTNPSPVVPSRAAPLGPGERIDSVELGADVQGEADSIETLLARLERGARRRPTPVTDAPPPSPAPLPGGSLEETLGSLRRLAVRG